MRNILIVLLILVLGCGRTENRQKTESTQQQIPTMPVPAFSGSQAFEYLRQQCAFGPRNPGSRAHEQCLNFLTQQLQFCTGAVTRQNFPHTGYEHEPYTMTNVIATFNAPAAKRILIAAHWDSRPRSDRETSKALIEKPVPGANDGASGVAVLLELARIMKNNPPPIGVDLVLFDGEDFGKSGDLDNYFLGSRYFAASRPPGFNPRFGILLDMIGDRALQLPKEGFSVQYAPDVVQLVWDTARELGLPAFTDAVGPMVEDDHVPMNNAGIRMIDIIDSELIGGNTASPERNYWHTQRDTPDRCSAQSLETVGTLLATIIYNKAVNF